MGAVQVKPTHLTNQLNSKRTNDTADQGFGSTPETSIFNTRKKSQAVPKIIMGLGTDSHAYELLKLNDQDLN